VGEVTNLVAGGVKVRAADNPYDPAWELYFEERLGATMKQALTGERRYGHLWDEQGGRCPVCRQTLPPSYQPPVAGHLPPILALTCTSARA